MKIVHRIGLRTTATQRRELEALGLKLPSGRAMPGGGDPLLTFDVDEAHPSWRSFSSLFERWKASDVVQTEFEKKELDAARWLEISAWHHGYPQPEPDVFGYRRATYDLSDWCERCGIGMVQRAPFQMKGEPKWGRHALLQLVWVYDELFSTPGAWTRVFRPAGVACRPVFGVNGVELATVVQLVASEAVTLVTDGLPFELCERCGRRKYLPVTRGAFPALRDEPTGSLVRTAEYFGSGAQADQRLLISQELTRALKAEGVRGAALIPVTDSGAG